MPFKAKLSHLGVLKLQGIDSRTFLQGQLSADTRRLSANGLLLSGYHSREGRVIAILRLLAPAPDVVLAVLPRELIATVAERLRKFVLRAKTTLSDASADWRLTGFIAGERPADALHWPGSTNRWIRIAPEAQSEPPLDDDVGTGSGTAVHEFHAGDIADGLPQVYATTADRFVAQMLNLDALGAIAFDKGCYTGQEVIARAHYRGRVKRRLQRFRALVDVSALQPGAQGQLSDGRNFTVIDSIAEGSGGTQFLAVLPLEASSVPETGPAPGRTEQLRIEALPLSYLTELSTEISPVPSPDA